MSQQQLPLGVRPAQAADGAVESAPGAVWLPGWLSDDAQFELVDAFHEWAEPPAGLRRPTMPNGAPFSTQARLEITSRHVEMPEHGHSMQLFRDSIRRRRHGAADRA